MKTALNSSSRHIRVLAIIALLFVALLFVAIVSTVTNIYNTEPASKPDPSDTTNTNSLYQTAVQAEQSPVATVNNQVIGAEAFNKLYLARTGHISSTITIKDVKKALALKRQIVGQLIVNTLVDQAAAKQNITVDKREIDASIDRLKKTFPSPEKYDLHVAQLPGGENYLRNVARTNLLKEKLVDVMGIKPDEKAYQTTKAAQAATAAQAKNGNTTESFIRNALLIQQLKTQADISNLLEERHIVMLHQTKLAGFSRAKIKVADN